MGYERNRKQNKDRSIQDLNPTGPAIWLVKCGRSQRLMNEN